MKQILNTLLGILVVSSSLFAQSKELKEKIDAQYLSPSHKAFLYQVSPQTKAADMWLIEQERKAELDAQQASAAPVSTDTTWSYTEYKTINDSLYMPTSASYHFLVGDKEGSNSINNEALTWNRQDSKWYKRSIQKAWYFGTHQDSSITLYFANGDTLPNRGSKMRYPETPSEGASREIYSDTFVKDYGWKKNTWMQYYKNENGLDTLRVEYSFHEATMEYKRTSETRNQRTDDYQLSSSKYIDSDGNITSWNYNYTEINSDQSVKYQLTKQYDAVKKQLVGKDSTQFIYEDGYVEGLKFSWDGSAWRLANMYRSFQRSFANPNPDDTFHPTITQVDSVNNYIVYPDSTDENGDIAIGDVLTRTEFDHNEYGNLIEKREYSMHAQQNVMIIWSRTEYDYVRINGRSLQTRSTIYTLINTEANELYINIDTKWVYDELGTRKEYSYVFYSDTGDTTRAQRTVYVNEEDGTKMTFVYSWHYQNKIMYLKNYTVSYSQFFEVDYHYMKQDSRLDNLNNGNRTINTRGNYPVVFNDGPILAEKGDTLSFYLSGRNIDFSIPSITITDLPATASYNSETRKFFWIVDEEKPAPMHYTATNSNGSATVEVRFVNMDMITVDNEQEYTVGTFELKQNYPNPFNPTTNISFNLPKAGEVALTVYNMLGQQVATLVQGRMSAGTQTVQFNASNFASGMYIYRLQSANFVETRKMMLIK